MAKQIRRRDIMRGVPLVVVGAALGGFGRAFVACTDDTAKVDRTLAPAPTTAPPTDGNEFVAPTGAPPVNGGDLPPIVPNQAWEARAKQLEDEQTRLYGPVFSALAEGIFVGKSRSHVPVVTTAVEGGYKRVTLLVQHVMGKSGIDAGAGDGGGKDAAADAGDAGDAGDASDAATDAAPVDAGAPVVHYITTMYLRATVNGANTVVGLWEFASTDAAPPSVKLTIPTGVTSVVAYEWCTLHGLWKADPLVV